MEMNRGRRLVWPEIRKSLSGEVRQRGRLRAGGRVVKVTKWLTSAMTCPVNEQCGNARNRPLSRPLSLSLSGIRQGEVRGMIVRGMGNSSEDGGSPLLRMGTEGNEGNESRFTIGTLRFLDLLLFKKSAHGANRAGGKPQESVRRTAPEESFSGVLGRLKSEKLWLTPAMFEGKIMRGKIVGKGQNHGWAESGWAMSGE